MWIFVWLAVAWAVDAELDLSGTVDVAGADHVLVPFEVPEGIAEIEVQHGHDAEGVILDWGLDDPAGFRGWGGGNVEHAVVGEQAASRSYLAGPVPAGTWNVVVGKAQLAGEPVSYDLRVFLREAPTLAPEPQRSTYEPVPALREGPDWYAGDLHVHSRQSGDASPSMDAAATFAEAQGLDFIELSEHNTSSQMQLMNDVQDRHPDLLLLPGIEVTTYDGHANAIGATRWVNHRVGLDGLTATQMVQQVHDQGALFGLNHPTLALGDLCIGCAWEHDVDGGSIDAYEIITGSVDTPAGAAHPSALAAWDVLCAEGHHVAAIGGSDDHRGGQGTGLLDSPIGSPTTLVYAERLDAASILAGIRAGRTVVKLGGPDDPMVTLWPDAPLDGDTVTADSTVVEATVTDGLGHRVLLFVDGLEAVSAEVDTDPFVLAHDVKAPATGQRRVRAEVWDGGSRRTVTSHVWVQRDLADPDPVPVPEDCGCAGVAGRGVGLGGLFLVVLLGRRRAA